MLNLKSTFILLMAANSFLASGQIVIPNNKGFSGFVQISAGYFGFRTNQVSGFLKSDLSNPVTNSFTEKPTHQSTTTSVFPFEVSYTFKSGKTQLLAGSALEDLLRMDLTQQIAFRQSLGRTGILQAGFLLSSIPVRLWKDPYITNIPREETTRQSFGGRIGIFKILESPFGFQYALRKITIDETSGEYLGLPNTEQALLNRNGVWHHLTLYYHKNINQKNIISPTLNLVHDDTKGSAVRRSSFLLQMSYAFVNQKVRLITNAGAGYLVMADVNPIFNEQQKNLNYLLREIAYYRISKPDKVPLFITASVTYGTSESNINFFSDRSFLFAGGLFMTFGGRIPHTRNPEE